MVTARFQAAEHFRQPREDVWLDARKRYEPQYVNRRLVRKPPFVKVPYVFRTVNMQVSQLLSASEANGRWVAARSNTPEHGNVGDVVTLALERQFRRKSSDLSLNVEEHVERCARNGILYGNAWVYLENFRKGDDWGVKATNLDPMDVFPDWKDLRWVIVRRWVTVGQLRDMALSMSEPTVEFGVDEAGEPVEIEGEPRDGGRAARAFKKLLKQVREGITNTVLNQTSTLSQEKQLFLSRINDFNSDIGTDSSVDPETDPSNVRVQILQYDETASDGIVALVVPGFNDGEDLIFRAEENPYGICTVVPFVPYPVDNEVFGFGISEIVGHIAEVMDHSFRSQSRLIAKHSDAPLVAQKAANLPRHFIDNPAGKNVEVVGGPRNVLAYLQPPDSAVLPAIMLQQAKTMADLGTGENEQRRGGSGGTDTATEAAIVANNSNMNDRLLFRRWRKFIEQVGAVMLEILKVHVTRTQLIPQLGRDTDRFLELKPEFLRGSFEVEFGGSPAGMNPQQEVAFLLNFYTTFATSGVVDVAAVARKIAFKMGEKNPDDLLLADLGRPKVSAATENIAVFEFGQDIDQPHPQDDDLQHLMSHGRFVARIQAQQPDHPGLAKMLEHIQMHLFQQQQKQAQLGAAPPGTPSQPGGNGTGQTPPGASGNPAVLTPDTAAALAARQTSNFNAAGQAPGGIVPNRFTGGPR